MKGRIALLFALFTLFLSTESSFMLHFCHNQFVAAAFNKEISTCCKKKAHPGPVVTSICCELSSFDIRLNDTVVNNNSKTIILPSFYTVVYEKVVVSIFLNDRLQEHINRPPPKRPNRDLHIIYAQYLI